MSGWKLVPVDPNTPQRRIGQSATGSMDLGHDAYTRMTQAAPSPPEDVLERMARAFISSWFSSEPAALEAILCEADQKEAIAAMRAALAAAEERTQPNPQGEDHAR